MNWMDLQRNLPAHLGVPFRLSFEAATGRYACACLLFGGHRLLRWVLACRDGWSADGLVKPRMEDLGKALLKAGKKKKKGAKGPLTAAVKKALKDKDAEQAINDLLTATELFLSPDMVSGTEDATALAGECGDILHRLATAFEPVLEVTPVTGGPKGPDTLFGWSGPGGHGASRATHGFTSPVTALLLPGSDEPAEQGPATATEPPAPLLPCAGPKGGGWWECPNGRVYDADGLPAAPLMNLTPAGALGRLLFWNLSSDENPVHLADRLVDTGSPEAGGVLLVTAVATQAETVSPESFEEAVHFLAENELQEQGEALTAFFVEGMEALEARLREADDLKGVSDVLLKRQQLEKGPQKVLTLSRLANLFREKLDDPDAGFVCLVSALEEAPDDDTILGDLVEEAGRSGKEKEAAERLLELAGEQAGDGREALSRAAGQLYMAGEPDPEKAAAAMKIALESAPEDIDLLQAASDVAIKLGDHTWLEELFVGRRDHAADNASRLEAVLALALLYQEERPEEAADLYHQALILDPNHQESFEALVAIRLKMGKPEVVREECEGLLTRTFDPAMRADILKRYASLMMDVFKDEAAAARALSEALLLDPEDGTIPDLLGTLYEGLGEWRRLIGFLRRRANAEPDNATHHLLQMAEIARRNLEDTDAALGFLTEAAALAPDDQEPRRLIRTLHEELGLWADVARDLEESAGKAPAEDRMEILTNLGTLYLDRLSLRGRAKDTLWRALESAPSAARADLAGRLAALHREDGENEREFDALKAAVEAMGDDEKAADLYAEMGRLAMEPPQDEESARKSLEKAVALNPVHTEAVERLAGMLLEHNEPERVITLVEPLAAKAAQDEDSDAERRLRLLGAGAAMKCADREAAAAQYARAVELDPADHRTQVILGRLQAQAGQDKEASELLTAVLEEAGESLTPMDRIEVLHTVAGCATRQGDHAKALDMLDSAYRLRGTVDGQSLRDLAVASQEAGAHEKTVGYLQELVSVETKGPQRFADKMQLGDLLRGPLEDPARALAWYMEATEEGVSPKAALHKALDAAVTAGENEQAKTILERVLDLEQDGAKRAQYHYALALHVMEHLKDSATARQHLWTALETHPDQEDAVKALENILSAEKDEEGLARLFQLLARHYRLTGQEDKLQHTLRRLAEGYDERLDNPLLAAEALQQMLKNKPDDLDATIRLAEVLTRAPGKENEALGAHRRVLEIDPTSDGSYRAIRDLCVVMGDEDGAWTAASALRVLGNATEADKAAFEAGRHPALLLKRDSLPEGTFEKLITDRRADPGMARVLDILYDPLRSLLPWKKPADLGLSYGDLMDMGQRGMFQNMAAAGSKVLGIPLPRVYRTKGRNGLTKLAFDPPALAAGDDVVEGWRGKELRFGLGRALVTFAPGFQLTGISEVETLRLFFLAALQIAFDDYPVPEDAVGVKEMAKDLSKKLTPEMRTEIHAILTVFRRDQKHIDTQAFLQGVDLTASRAGLFLANDLYVAAGLLSEDAIFLSDLEYGDRVTDLCAWTVSARYAQLRRRMLRSGSDPEKG